MSEYLARELALLHCLQLCGYAHEIGLHERSEAAREAERRGFALPTHEYIRFLGGAKMLSLANVVVPISRTSRAVGPISLDVPGGQVLAVVGPNGAGKTTLLKAVGGHIRPKSGDIALGGRSLLALSPYQRNVATAFQEGGLLSPLSLRRNIRITAATRTDTKHHYLDEERIFEMLDLSNALDTRAELASGGERQLTSIVRALSARPDYLLLDEPTASLDGVRKQQLHSILTEYLGHHKIPVMMVSHDAPFVLQIADLVATLNSKGTLIECVPVSSVLQGQCSFATAQLLCFSNLFKVQRSGDSFVLDDWIAIPSSSAQPPSGLAATGVWMRREALALRGPGQDVGSGKPDWISIEGWIESRRRAEDGGECIVFRPDPATGSDRGFPRSLFFARPQHAVRETAQATLQIDPRGLTWLE